MAIEPIRLTEFGETMRVEFPYPHTADKLSDANLLKCNGASYVGIHEADNGFVYFKPVSVTHGIIYCAVCGRITKPIPIDQVGTYGKLREWCRAQIEQDELEWDVLRPLIEALRVRYHQDATTAVQELLKKIEGSS